MQMNKDAVLAALEHGQTVCCGTSRWHVGHDKANDTYYKFNVMNGAVLPINKFDRCYIHTGGVGSDD